MSKTHQQFFNHAFQYVWLTNISDTNAKPADVSGKPMTLQTCFRFCFVILLTASFCACKSYTVSFESEKQNEIKYYNLQENDTVLDFSVGQYSILPLTATTVDNLYFYLGSPPTVKPYLLTSTQRTFKYFKKKFKSDNRATFIPIQQRGDSILLNNNSVDCILCRNNLYRFNDFNVITSEFIRILKPNGQLIILQQQADRNELSKKDLKTLKDSPLPNEKDLIAYFEQKGCKNVMSRTVIYNRHMKKVTDGNYLMLKFSKASR